MPSNITDLTGTKWRLNEMLDLTTTGVTPVVDSAPFAYLLFTSDGNPYTEIRLGSTNAIRWNILGYVHNGGAETAYNFDAWVNQAYRIIEITGGTDATNANLISWIQTNAEQIIEPAGQTLTLTLTNGTLTSISETLTPSAIKYAAPSTVTVSGATPSYTPSTGVLNLTAPTSSISVTAEAALAPKRILKINGYVVGKVNGQYVSTVNEAPVQCGKAASSAMDFATDSWATIAANIKGGNDTYQLGDTKTDTVTIDGSTYSVTWRIVDDTVGRYVTQSGTSHKVIMMDELVGLTDSSGVAFNSSGSAASFNGSSLKTDLNSTILGFLPQALQNVLETTTVYSGDGTQDASAATNVSATCKLFVPSFTELYGASETSGYANSSEGTPQFTYYSGLGVTTSNYSALIRHLATDPTTDSYYWTRSPYYAFPRPKIGLIFSAVIVSDAGLADIGNVDASDRRAAPCFAF